MLKENVTVIFDRKKQAAKRGSGKVELRIYLGRTERKYISLGDFPAEKWEKFASSPQVKAERRKCEQIVGAMELLGNEMTIATFDAYYYGEEEQPSFISTPKKVVTAKPKTKVQPSINFIEYMKEHIKAEDISEGTRKHKQCTLNALKRFGKIQKLTDLTSNNLVAFDEWLHDGTRSDVGIHTYHKHLKKYSHLLYIEGKIGVDPYTQVKFKRGECKEREPLTEAELQKLRKIKLDDKLDKVRDLFVFSAYTGLAYCDVQAFDFEKMTEQQGKLYYIDGSRIKTASKFFTPILGPAMEVLKKYKFVLPKISNQKANDFLHLIETALKLNKPLTFHVARHSFATLALAHDIPIENVSRMLGHKNIRTTQIYAKVLKTTIERHAENLQRAIR